MDRCNSYSSVNSTALHSGYTAQAYSMAAYSSQCVKPILCVHAIYSQPLWKLSAQLYRFLWDDGGPFYPCLIHQKVVVVGGLGALILYDGKGIFQTEFFSPFGRSGGLTCVFFKAWLPQFWQITANCNLIKMEGTGSCQKLQQKGSAGEKEHWLKVLFRGELFAMPAT